MFLLPECKYDLLQKYIPFSKGVAPRWLSIVEGKPKGIILTDNLSDPTIFLCCKCYGDGFLTGEVNLEYHLPLLMNIDEQLLSLSNPVLFVCCSPHINQNGLQELCSRNGLYYEPITYYKKLELKKALTVESLYKIGKINEHVYNAAISNPSYSVLRVLWESYDLFKRNSFGYYAYNDEGIIGLAFVALSCKTAIEPQPFILREYRNKGIGHALCSLVLEDAIQYGFECTWNTSPNNLPSRRLAAKLGYKEEHSTGAFDIKINKSKAV